MPKKKMADVVVLLPGIGGSTLERDGKDVWAMSGGAIARGLFSLGRSVKDLALDEDPHEVDDLGDGVTAPRLMSAMTIIPGLWKIDVYQKVSQAIQAAFDVEVGANYFEFPYDWRRDNRVAARRLARQSHDWLKKWRERSGNADAKLILLGHSMGGIISRTYLELFDGWKDTRALITFGTPYRGSLNAVDFVANGQKKKLGPFTLVDMSALIRSFTSVYQLLPIYPCFDPGDGKLVRVTETDKVPNLDAKRAAAALGFHTEIRDAVTAHQADPAYTQPGYSVHPIVGMFQPTSQSARLVGDKVEVLRAYQGKDQDGDGTVPRVSATPIDLSNQHREVFVAERHASIQNADPVLVQLSGLMTGFDMDLSAFYAINSRVSLDLDDLYAPDEPVLVKAQPEDPRAVLTVSVVDTETGTVVRQSGFTEADEGWCQAELAPLPPGDYRLSVQGQPNVDPVTDIFAVMAPET